MKSPRFEVEEVNEITGLGTVVFARRLDNYEFLLRKGSLLGGFEVQSGDIPRVVNADGTVRVDLWGFLLKEPDAAKYFHRGLIVELTEKPGSEPEVSP